MSDVWEARPPPQLILAVSLLAVLLTLDGLALGQLINSGQRSPQVAGALAIALACGQVAVATIFFTLGGVGFARKGLLVLAAIAYGGGLLSAAATTAIRWDAACGELFILASLVAIPGVIMRSIGLRLIHRSAANEPAARPWQFTLEGGLALLTASACFFAAIRWITASPGSGVGVILEWLLLVSLPWTAFLLVSLPVHPLASLVGVLLIVGLVAGLSALVATFLSRTAMGLTASVEMLLAATLLATLRWAGYEVRLAGPTLPR
jgi:hypothetical protein